MPIFFRRFTQGDIEDWCFSFVVDLGDEIDDENIDHETHTKPISL